MQSTKDALKALIKLSGLNQKEYAQKHNIEYKKFNRWTTGRVIVSFEKLQELAFYDGFKINVEYSIINL